MDIEASIVPRRFWLAHCFPGDKSKEHFTIDLQIAAGPKGVVGREVTLKLTPTEAKELANILQRSLQ